MARVPEPKKGLRQDGTNLLSLILDTEVPMNNQLFVCLQDPRTAFLTQLSYTLLITCFQAYRHFHLLSHFPEQMIPFRKDLVLQWTTSNILLS